MTSPEEAVERVKALADTKANFAMMCRAEAIEIANGKPESVRYHPEARDYYAQADKAEKLAADLRSLLSALQAAEARCAELEASPPAAEGLSEEVKGADISALADKVCLRVCEYDDRTSPQDWPEALLITSEELHSELMQFADAILSALAAKPREDQGSRPPLLPLPGRADWDDLANGTMRCPIGSHEWCCAAVAEFERLAALASPREQGQAQELSGANREPTALNPDHEGGEG